MHRLAPGISSPKSKNHEAHDRKVQDIVKIIALGLRRSGTTAFWQVFHRLENFVAFDEPFNTMLRDLPKTHFKGTWEPIRDLYCRDTSRFKTHYAPIEKSQELETSITTAQLRYLNFLCDSHANVFIDSTRLLMKAQHLAPSPEKILIHLYRSPIGFVSSHLLPSYGGLRSQLNRRLNQILFWRRQSGFNTWSIEKILKNHYGELTSVTANALGLPPYVDRNPAVIKLLHYWLLHYRKLQQDFSRWNESNSLSVNFDDFCRDPTNILNALNERTGIDAKSFVTTHLKPASMGFNPSDSRWPQAMVRAGFSSEEIERFT